MRMHHDRPLPSPGPARIVEFIKRLSERNLVKLNRLLKGKIMKTKDQFSKKHGTPDMVNHPPHYNQGNIECIDAIRAMLSPEEFRGYLRGTSLKYRWRYQYKDGMQDIEKAEWYEKRLKEHESIHWMDPAK